MAPIQTPRPRVQGRPSRKARRNPVERCEPFRVQSRPHQGAHRAPTTAVAPRPVNSELPSSPPLPHRGHSGRRVAAAASARCSIGASFATTAHASSPVLRVRASHRRPSRSRITPPPRSPSTQGPGRPLSALRLASARRLQSTRNSPQPNSGSTEGNGTRRWPGCRSPAIFLCGIISDFAASLSYRARSTGAEPDVDQQILWRME